MLRLAIVFLVVALIAGLFGFMLVFLHPIAPSLTTAATGGPSVITSTRRRSNSG